MFVDRQAGQKIVEIADTLIDQGYADVAFMQITGSTCKVTFCSQSTTKSIAKHGFFLGETHIAVRHSFSLQVHIFDFPIWISDAAMIHALAKYDTVQGTIRHGRTRTKSGAFVGTGVRFATVPSLLYGQNKHNFTSATSTALAEKRAKIAVETV